MTTGQGMGSVRIALTDAPACGFDEVNITVDRVRVHASSTADDSSSGWHDLVLAPARKVNLLDLTNGVLEELGEMALPGGQYTQLRLVLRPDSGGVLANSVVPTGGTEQPLDTPSATQSGLKLIHSFTVPPGGLADVVLDFDACKSIVRRGNGSYGLKPVIAVVPRTVADIVGYVDPAIAGMQISAQVGGTVMRATVPDASGAFTLAFLDPSVAPNVAVVFAAPGFASAVVSAVPIALQGTTSLSTAATPITLPASATRTASGHALPAVAAASVRAVQAVGIVPEVEIASTNADATGAYSLTLPTAPALLAPYAVSLPLVFAPQPASAAKYTLEAEADGYVAQSAAIDLTAADAAVDFTLPPAP
ncbi:MAG TPA: DUF4382 domain-containing protein [Burkholderiaceae bacterium]|nr:DUF4382 domain-containing protein [Burkholderiaceae bacterium]